MSNNTTRSADYETVRSRFLRFFGDKRKLLEQQIEPKEAEPCVCELWGPSGCPRCSPVFGDET
jgi:hypothetical protein